MVANLKALWASIQRLQAVIEFKLDGTIETANDNFLDLMGYRLDEVVGKKHSIFVDPVYRESPEYRDFWGRLNAGESFTSEFKRVTKSGRIVWLQATYTPVLDTNGKPYKVVKFATDRSVQHEIDEEHRVRAEMVDKTSIVSTADLRGDILSVNDKFVEVSKYSRDELIGQPHSTTRHPDMPKEVFKELWGTIGRGKTFRGMIKNRAKDGTPYYVDAIIAPVIGENGKPRKYIGVRYDITEAETERQEAKGIVSAINSTSLYTELSLEGNILAATTTS